MAREYSSSAVRSGTVPISFRYIRTGSSVPIPSKRSTASRSISSPSSSLVKSSSSKPRSSSSLSSFSSPFSSFFKVSSSRTGVTSTPLFSRRSRKFSICSSVRDKSFTAVWTSPMSIELLLPFALIINSSIIFSNSSLSKFSSFLRTKSKG